MTLFWKYAWPGFSTNTPGRENHKDLSPLRFSLPGPLPFLSPNWLGLCPFLDMELQTLKNKIIEAPGAGAKLKKDHFLERTIP